MTAAHALPPELLRENHPFRQWKTWTVPGTRLTVTGYSRSNDKTFFHLPELRACIDAGQCAGRRPDTVLLTHTHDDHATDLEYLAGKDPAADLYVPAEAEAYISAFIRAKREMNQVAAYDPARAGSYRLHGVRPDDTFDLLGGRYRVRVVPCVHKVPCVGYAFSEVRKRLKPEFEKLKSELGAGFGKRMAEARKAGESPEEVYDAPLFVFMGDTHPAAFALAPWVLDYPVVFTECTFLSDAEKERADKAGHTVWSALRPVVEARPQTLFVLTHFSLRHSDREVVVFFEKVRKAGVENIVPWAHADSFLPELHQRSGEE